jgi:ribosome-binding factor A
MESKRQLQAAELIKRNISLVLQQEGNYIYGDALVTVTKVMVTPDLSLAKIYCSVYNADDKQTVIDMLNHDYIRIKQYFVTRIRKHIRRIPDFDFFIDDTLDEMQKLNELFDRLHDQNEMGEEE